MGLPTGSTPIGMYEELVRLHTKEGLDFSRVRTFNLDEYYGLSPENPLSYNAYMHLNFFRHVNIAPANIHVPDGLIQTDRIAAYCKSYDELIQKLGGLDLTVMGIGRLGHIGFNEPGSPFDSRTRLVDLLEETRIDNSRFFPSLDAVPRQAITMGISTIMGSQTLILLASGGGKADILAKALEGPVTEGIPASILQRHENAIIIADEAAASKLKRRA